MNRKRILWAQVEGMIAVAICAVVQLLLSVDSGFAGDDTWLLYAIFYVGGVVHHLWWDRWTERAFIWVVTKLSSAEVSE